MTDVFKSRRTHQKGRCRKGYGDLNPFSLGMSSTAPWLSSQDGELSKYRKVYLRRRIRRFFLFTQSTIKRTQTFKEDLIMSISRRRRSDRYSMKSDLEVNYDKLAGITRRTDCGKTDAIIICERPENLQQCRRGTQQSDPFCHWTCKPRIPVIAGTGSNSTRTAIQLSGKQPKTVQTDFFLSHRTTTKRRKTVWSHTIHRFVTPSISGDPL